MWLWLHIQNVVVAAHTIQKSCFGVSGVLVGSEHVSATNNK
jgi:hypothetical protein